MARSPRSSGPPPSLGSLTQRADRGGETCRSCGSDRVTRITMNLTDGSPVAFTSCRSCDHRSWEEDGTVLPVSSVLDKTRKPE